MNEKQFQELLATVVLERSDALGRLARILDSQTHGENLDFIRRLSSSGCREAVLVARLVNQGRNVPLDITIAQSFVNCLGLERGEGASEFGKALRRIGDSHPDWSKELLRSRVVESPKPVSELVMFLDGCLQFDPSTFAAALKRVTADGPTETSFSGVLLHRLGALPPENDPMIETSVRVVIAALRDDIWMRRVSSDGLADMIRDLLLLATAIVKRELFHEVLQWCKSAVIVKETDQRLRAALAAPLVALKGDIERGVNWIEDEYRLVLADPSVPNEWAHIFAEILEAITKRTFRNMSSNRAVEEGQIWRRYLNERIERARIT